MRRLAAGGEDGATLSWWLGEEPEEAKLEIIDAAGVVVRTFEPAEPDAPRDRWSGAALPTGRYLRLSCAKPLGVECPTSAMLVPCLG